MTERSHAGMPSLHSHQRVALAGVLGLDTCRHRYRCHCQCLHGNRLIPTHPTDRPARTCTVRSQDMFPALDLPLTVTVSNVNNQRW